MGFLDYINIGCTIFSLIGAWRAFVYYRKSRLLTIYANTNSAYLEINQIMTTLTELLKLANPTQKRGINVAKEVSAKGEAIKNSINVIREDLTAEYIQKFNTLLNDNGFNLEKYIDSLITGYHIVLLFDSEDKFIAVSNETSV